MTILTSSGGFSLILH